MVRNTTKILFCSLCHKSTKAQPLDMDDTLFGNYIRLMRKLGISHHKGQLGVCSSCMPSYVAMQKKYSEKQILYILLAIVFGALYLYFTQNPALALLIALLVFSLSFFHYVPPMKR